MPVLGLLIVLAIVAFLFVGGGSETTTVEQGQNLKTQVNTEVLILPWRDAIRSHQATYGNYPESLDEIQGNLVVPEGYELDYDPATGHVEFVAQ